ncbi:MAG: hypothetical protein U0941_26670 [Planctomycetaceae bacterium]
MLNKLLTSRAGRWYLPTVFLCGFSYCSVFAGEGPSSDSIRQVDASTRRIEVRDSDSLVLQYPDWLKQVKSLDPAVVRVSAIRPDRLKVQRVAQGTAKLQVLDRSDHKYSLEIVFQDSTDKR